MEIVYKQMALFWEQISGLMRSGGFIVESLTEQRAVELHRKLWNYIADETDRS